MPTPGYAPSLVPAQDLTHQVIATMTASCVSAASGMSPVAVVHTIMEMETRLATFTAAARTQTGPSSELPHEAGSSIDVLSRLGSDNAPDNTQCWLAMTALQVVVATICLFQMTRDVGTTSGATVTKTFGGYRSTAESIGTLGISSILRMICYILLGCPIRLGCFGMLSWNESSVSGRINEAALVDIPLKSLSTTWTHHCYRMKQQPTGCFRRPKRAPRRICSRTRSTTHCPLRRH